jgi:hypothetical protein
LQASALILVLRPSGHKVDGDIDRPLAGEGQAVSFRTSRRAAAWTIELPILREIREEIAAETSKRITDKRLGPRAS